MAALLCVSVYDSSGDPFEQMPNYTYHKRMAAIHCVSIVYVLTDFSAYEIPYDTHHKRMAALLCVSVYVSSDESFE